MTYKKYKKPKEGCAANLTGIKKIDIKALWRLEINDNVALVRIELYGICGNDIHEYK